MALMSSTDAIRAEPWDHPKPAWIVLIILGFLVSWPIGLLIFGVLLMTGRLNGWKRAGLGLWQEGTRPMRNSCNWWQPRSSGNNYFDEYRTETLRRLEEEEKEFHEFLNRLRAAKDKSEFDQFMADRRHQGTPTSESPRN